LKTRTADHTNGGARYPLVSLARLDESDAIKKYDEAERYAREALKLDAGCVDAYAVLAGVYARQRRSKDLDQTLARLDENDSDDLSPYYEAAQILLLKSADLARAESYFRKYLSQEPEAGSPPLAAAHWRLGQTLEKEGRKADAIAELETALRLQPDFLVAKKDLARLK
jgi:tetratricopeptide (TPR) repeat protein